MSEGTCRGVRCEARAREGHLAAGRVLGPCWKSLQQKDGWTRLGQGKQDPRWDWAGDATGPCMEVWDPRIGPCKPVCDTVCADAWNPGMFTCPRVPL